MHTSTNTESKPIRKHWRHRKVSQAKPPGPHSYLPFVIGLHYVQNPFGFFQELREDFGSFHMHESLGKRFYIIYDAENIEHVLVRNAKSYSKDLFLKSWHEVFGEGLLTADGEKWKHERKLVQPAFNRERIAGYTSTMVELTEKETLALDHASNEETPVAINRFMARLTLEIATRTLFGTTLSSDRIRCVGDALDECTEYFEKTFHPVGYMLQRFPVPSVLRYRKAVGSLDSVIREIVEARAGKSGDDLLSALLASQETEDYTQIRDEVMTLLLAGHETTALALTYTLWLLCKNPEAQKRARQEAQKIPAAELPKNLGNLPYLKSVIQESMRLYPPAWVLARQAVEDDTISGYKIPKGAQVIIPTWTIHRDPAVYKDPLEFRPERWTPEFMSELPRTSYLPFGFGPRMCVGMQFAMNELLAVLAVLLSRYEFTATDGEAKELGIRASITARPKTNVMLKVKALS